jgi:broad specificity phosphatase PhoE
MKSNLSLFHSGKLGDSGMSPIVHCVRHAQGVHNLSHANHHLLDPELTPLGEEQARALGARFPALENIQLILSSPLRRAIQTALLAFPSQVGDGGLQVVAWPEVQEASDLICDTGRDLLDIKAEFEELPVDFTVVEPGWHIKVRVRRLICLVWVRLSKLHV